MPRILIVEDNEMNRDMLSRRLIRRGYEVIEAVDGKAGLDISREHQPDLILMDISLPVMDGWEATLLLKASEDTRHIPIIILTAHATSDDRDKSWKVGSDDYESKPVEFARLIRKIEKLLHLPLKQQ
jgi:two-component system cell cycle response regulator DivK